MFDVPLRVGSGSARAVREVLVPHEHAVRHTGRARLEAHLPVALVAREEADIDARRDRVLDVVTLRLRPVLVVAHDEEALVVRQRVRVLAGVDIRRVRHVVAVLLGPAYERVLVWQELTRAITVQERAVVRHLRRVRRRPDRAVRVVVVQARTAVDVVRLVRVRARLEQQRLVAAVVAHDEHDDRAVAGRRHEAGEVDATHPRRLRLQRGGLRPVLLDHAVRRVGGRLDLTDTGERAERFHEPCACAAVVAHPVHVDRHAGRGGRHEQVERLPVVDADLRPVAGQVVRGRRLAEVAPFGVAGQRVLDLDRVQRSRRDRGRGRRVGAGSDGVDRGHRERVGRAVGETRDVVARRGGAGLDRCLRRRADVRGDAVAGDRAAAVRGRRRPGERDGGVARAAADARRRARSGRCRRRDRGGRGRVGTGADRVDRGDRERVGRAVREAR